MNGNANISTELLSAVEAIKTAILQSQARAVQVRSGGQTVTGFGGSDPNALYLPLITDGLYEAYYTTKDKKEKDVEVVAGQLNVVSYTQQSINVCLVGVNGTRYQNSISELAAYLNKVFGQAVTNVNLTTASIDVDKFNGTLSAKESGALSAYNSDMKKLIRKVKKLPDYTDDTYYIMLVAKSDNPALGGFMPVNSNFGFVFAQANSGAGQMNRTIAHELAHGAFRLWHTFSSENLYTAPQGTTRNLMDYNGTNSELYKYQWDYIHNPQAGIVRWMVDESESEVRELTSIKWIGDWFEGYFYDELEKIVESDLPTYNEIASNFESYYDKKTSSIGASWSIRKPEKICGKIFEKILQKENPEFLLSEKGIYTEKYNLEDKEYKVAVLSYFEKVNLVTNNIKLDSYSKLADSKYVKAGYTKQSGGYGIIVFYDGGKPLMTIQIMSDEPQIAVEKWLNYLSLILPSEEQKQEDGENIKGFEIHPIEKLIEIWNALFKSEDFKKLQQIEELTPKEIREYRDYIKTLPENEQAQWYLELQKKVPYHNQMDNKSQLTKVNGDIVNIGGVMCNVTSMAMALEMLGLENPCAPDIEQFEDCIESKITYVHTNTFSFEPLNDGNQYDDAREWPAGRESALTNMYGDKIEKGGVYTYVVKKDIDKIKKYIMDRLSLGDGVIVSYAGHFIRIISCNDDGYIYDDPYGQYDIANNKKGRSWKKENGDNEINGCKNERKWSDFDVLTEENEKKFYIEYYHEK